MTAYIKGQRFLRYVVLAGLGVTLIFSPLGGVHSAEAAQTATVNVDRVNLRSGPGTETALVGQAYKGNKLPVLAKSGDWYKVQVAGKTAWVAGWLVGIQGTTSTSQAAAPSVTQASGKVAVVTSDTLNVRSGPGTNYNIAGKVKKGDRLNVLSQSGDWVKVQNGNVTGWVANWLVSIQNTPITSTKPTTSTPTTSTKPATSNGSQVAVIAADNLNLRSGPGTNHNVAGQVGRGVRLPVISRSGDWVQVQRENGTTAWVAGWLVSVVDQLPTQTQQPQTPQNSEGDKSWLPGSVQPEPAPKPTEQKPSDENKPAAKLVNVQVKEKNDHTYVNIVSDKALDYHTFFLSSPSRYVVNLNEVQLANIPETISAGTELVDQIRTDYEENPYVSRLVLDLKSAVKVTAELSADKKSLTLDISKIAYSDGLAGKTIFLDAGHGGSDGGAIGQYGVREKDINLAITLKVGEILRQQGANVIFSRSDDTFIGLYERTAMANNQNSDIFVSIHSNANTNRAINGTSTYYYAPETLPALYEQREDRHRLAEDVQREMIAALGRRDIGVLQANFAVLRTSTMPSILIETAFVSNNEEENLLNSADFQQRAAEAIVRGISSYFSGK